MQRGVMNRWFVGAALGAILVVTLRPGLDSLVVEPTACILCGDQGTADLILNIVLFVPLGIAVGMLGIGYRKIFLMALLLSAGIETVQILIPGRDPSWGDLVANTLGALVGGTLARSRVVLFDSNTSRAAKRSLVAAVIVLGVFVGTGLLLQPDWPATTYYGQWTPDLGHLDRYEGEVLEARVGNLSIPSERLPSSDEVRDALRARSVIRVTAVAGPTTKRVSSIFSIYDDRQRELLLVGPQGDDLVYRHRTLAARLRLDQPDIRVRDGMTTILRGDTLQVVVIPGGRATCIEIKRRRECDLGFTLGSGWSVLLYSEAFSETVVRLLGIVWMAALVFPFALLARHHPVTYGAAALLVAALLVVPARVGLLPTPPLEWGGATLGVAAWVSLRIVLGAAARKKGRTATGSVASPHQTTP